MTDATNRTEPPTATAVRVMHALGHRCSEVADAFGGYDCTCGEYSWSNAGSYPPGGGCPRGWNDARAAIAALPSDAVRLTPQDQPGEILRLQADISELRRDLAAERPRANDAARLAADARDELDRVREELADTKEHLGMIDTDRTVQDVKLEDQAAELSRLQAERRALWELLKRSVRTTRDVIRTPIPRWDEDPVVRRISELEGRDYLEGRCGKCGEELPALAQARDQTGTATLEVDGDTGPWYLRLLHEPVARTSEPGCLVHIDWARDGRMIGVEILPDQTATPSDLQVPPSLGANHAGTGDTATLAQTFPFGEFLDGELTARKIPRRMLRRALGLSLSEIDDLIEGRRELTRDLADRLGRFLGTSAELWLNLDRIHKAAHQPGDTAQPGGDVIDSQPTPGMYEIYNGWLAERSDECTCEGVLDGPFGPTPHRDGCGLVPMLNLSALPGFAGLLTTRPDTQKPRVLPSQSQKDIYQELLGQIWLYVDWRYVTRQLTTEQKELWTNAVEASGDPNEPTHADRWWRESQEPARHVGHAGPIDQCPLCKPTRQEPSREIPDPWANPLPSTWVEELPLPERDTADRQRRELLVCRYEDCAHPMASPEDDDCGQHEEGMS